MAQSRFNFLKISKLFLVAIILPNQALATRAYQDLLKALFDSYDPGVRPDHAGKPTEVGVSLYILAVTNIDEKDMTFSMTMYFRQTWNDSRLSFETPSNSGMDRIQLSGSDILKIWEPDTFIVNEVNSFMHKTFVPNQFVRITPQGTVLKSSRFTVTAICPMDLQFFPFDQQICCLELESFGFTMADVRYKWMNSHNSIGVSTDISLPTFRVLGHRSRIHEVSLTTGNYSRLIVDILFARSPGRFISRFFFPMILFVLVSLISLWAASDKISTLINFLNICFVNLFMAQGSSEMPPISYRTCLDTYFVICIVHIAFCLLASLLANIFAAPPRGAQSIEMTQRRGPVADDVETLVGREPSATHNLKHTIGELYWLVHLFVKIGLFATFALSNLIFFAVSTTASQMSLDDFVPLPYY